ncbi:OmpA family protein [Desulfosoma sp.]
MASHETSGFTYTPSWWIQNAATVELEKAVPPDKLPLEYRGKDRLYELHGPSGIIRYKKVQDDQGLAFYFDHQGRCYALVIYPRADEAPLRQETPPLTPSAPRERREAIHFDFDKFSIRPQDRPILDSHVSFLSLDKDSSLLLEGHTDSIGTDAYNMRLSVQRSLSAYHYMVRQGADPARLRISGHGENSPVADNKTPKGRALNRRVEFIVHP